jgi:4-amino-4-deoxy-L-arabinose transferase-like glycosyltransferase
VLRNLKSNYFFIFILLTLLFNSVFFNKYLMPLNWLLIGGLVIIIMIGSFIHFNIKWISINAKEFQKKIFTLSLLVNLISLFFIYLLCYLYNGTFFEPGAADSINYHETSSLLAKNYSNGNYNFEQYLDVRDYSDYGYFWFLSYVYYIFGPYTLIARLFNVIFFALTVKSVYKITEITYDTSIAKTAALITAFSPSLLFFIGVNLKEIVMIFILVSAVLSASKILILQDNNPKNYFLLILSIISLFLFRTVLGMVFIASFLIFYVLNIKLKKKIHKILSVLGTLVSISLVVYYLNSIGIISTILEVFGQSESQTDAELNDKISRGAGGGLSVQKVLVVPLLFVSVLIAPFATLVFLDEQVEIAWLFSGNLIKNILVFFALFGIWFSFKYFRKQTSLIISILFSYCIVLAVSAQTTSSRYQLVTIPFLNIFVAFGIHKLNSRQSKLFIPYLFFIFLAIFAWNYFKLSIRNLI